MVLVLLILGAVIVSGCAVSKETMKAYNDAKETFQKATAAGAKKCAPCQYAMAEAYMALADHEVKHYWRELENLKKHIEIVKEKSLEALRLTPCEEVPKPTPPAPPLPTPTPPTPPPAPPAPPPAPPVTPPAPPAPPPPTPPAPPPAPPAPPPPAPPTPPAPKPAPPPPKAAPVFDPVYFDVNKTNISPTAAKALDRNGAILKMNPEIKVEIGGHTDSGGPEKVNQKISEKRALSVKKYLMDKFGIEENRLVVKGYGSTRPIADNKTEEGRAKNRRVELRVLP